MQALLPEALIPLGLLEPPAPVASLEAAAAEPGWGAVLCGDPRQLGPILRSKASAAEAARIKGGAMPGGCRDAGK